MTSKAKYGSYASICLEIHDNIVIEAADPEGQVEGNGIAKADDVEVFFSHVISNVNVIELQPYGTPAFDGLIATGTSFFFSPLRAET